MAICTLKRPPVFREDGTIAIQLTKGLEAIIDAEDAALAELVWTADVRKTVAYAYRNEDGRAVRLHQMIMQPPLGMTVDHLDGDGLNCRRVNMRVCTYAENLRNCTLRGHNTSGYLGVSLHKKHGWQAEIRKNGERRHLGWFATAELANEARLAAERDWWCVQPRRRSAHIQSFQ